MSHANTTQDEFLSLRLQCFDGKHMGDYVLSRSSTVEANSRRCSEIETLENNHGGWAMTPALKIGGRRSSCECEEKHTLSMSLKDVRRNSTMMFADLHRCVSFPDIHKIHLGCKRASSWNLAGEKIERGKVLLQSMEFDTASFSDDELAVLVLEIFLQLHLHEHLDIPIFKLRLFIDRIRQHMFENPYHNWTHVVDVVQAAYSLGSISGLLQRLNPLQQFALLVSALCHDLEHPGVNNLSLVRSQPALSDLYGDSSSLEKHHSLRAFSLMLHHEVDLLGGLDAATYYSFRDMVTRIIMATDMSRHRDYCAKVEQLAEHNTDDVVLEMEILIKCADTSNVLRPMEIAKKWAVRIGDEFFTQGDLERSMGLSVTPTCDRESQTLVGMQKGFLDHCIGPFFDAVGKVYPSVEHAMKQAWINRQCWDAYDDEALYCEMGRC